MSSLVFCVLCVPLLEPWLDAWYVYVSGSYLKAYLQAMHGAPLGPVEAAELEVLLHCFLVQKAVHELAYDLYNRLSGVDLRLRELEALLKQCRPQAS